MLQESEPQRSGVAVALRLVRHERRRRAMHRHGMSPMAELIKDWLEGHPSDRLMLLLVLRAAQLTAACLKAFSLILQLNLQVSCFVMAYEEDGREKRSDVCWSLPCRVRSVTGTDANAVDVMYAVLALLLGAGAIMVSAGVMASMIVFRWTRHDKLWGSLTDILMNVLMLVLWSRSLPLVNQLFSKPIRWRISEPMLQHLDELTSLNKCETETIHGMDYDQISDDWTSTVVTYSCAATIIIHSCSMLLLHDMLKANEWREQEPSSQDPISDGRTTEEETGQATGDDGEDKAQDKQDDAKEPVYKECHIRLHGRHVKRFNGKKAFVGLRVTHKCLARHPRRRIVY